jgi:hypothetical protein
MGNQRPQRDESFHTSDRGRTAATRFVATGFAPVLSILRKDGRQATNGVKTTHTANRPTISPMVVTYACMQITPDNGGRERRRRVCIL